MIFKNTNFIKKYLCFYFFNCHIFWKLFSSYLMALGANSTLLTVETIPLWMTSLQSFSVYLTAKNYGYLYPLGVILANVNNVLIMMVFFKGKFVYIKISKSLKLYYIAMAISDITIIDTYYFSSWLGIDRK